MIPKFNFSISFVFRVLMKIASVEWIYQNLNFPVGGTVTESIEM